MAVKDSQVQPEDLLPMKPVEFLVFVALSDRERHGYGIVQDLVELSGGTVQLVPGNLYGILRRLLGRGLLDEAKRRPAPESGDQRRRYYGITEFGKQVLAAEAERMRGLVYAAEERDIIQAAARAS